MNSANADCEGLGASASNRLTEGLLASSGKVATVGLVTAVVTLLFAIWFGIELRRQVILPVGAFLVRSPGSLPEITAEHVEVYPAAVDPREPGALYLLTIAELVGR